MEGVELNGILHRIKKCAADLLSMENDLVDEEDDGDEDSWELIGRDFRLKSIFLYCDLTRVIPSYSDENKKTLTLLVNRLFDCMEELDSAVKSRRISHIQIYYSESIVALQEVIAALLPPQ